MNLADLMDRVAEPAALHVSAEGERLVAMRLADEWDVGVRLHQRDSYRAWDVLEIAVRSRGSHDSIDVDEVRDLPLRALIDEARRLATKSARPAPV